MLPLINEGQRVGINLGHFMVFLFLWRSPVWCPPSSGAESISWRISLARSSFLSSLSNAPCSCLLEGGKLLSYYGIMSHFLSFSVETLISTLEAVAVLIRSAMLITLIWSGHIAYPAHSEVCTLADLKEMLLGKNVGRHRRWHSVRVERPGEVT